jgi:hypothetical protein
MEKNRDLNMVADIYKNQRDRRPDSFTAIDYSEPFNFVRKHTPQSQKKDRPPNDLYDDKVTG